MALLKLETGLSFNVVVFLHTLVIHMRANLVARHGRGHTFNNTADDILHSMFMAKVIALAFQ